MAQEDVYVAASTEAVLGEDQLEALLEIWHVGSLNTFPCFGSSPSADAPL